MQLTTITVPPEVAYKRLELYRDLERTRKLTAVERVYKRALYHADQGHPIVDIQSTIGAGGCDDRGRPRLAIAPSDAERVRLTINAWGSAQGAHFHTTERYMSETRRITRNRVCVPREFFRGTLGTAYHTDEAVVPKPPIDVTSEMRYSLGTYHTLFEAEWKVLPREVDPYLLRHIGGTLYVVENQWDVTALEAAVLRAQLTGALVDDQPEPEPVIPPTPEGLT